MTKYNGTEEVEYCSRAISDYTDEEVQRIDDTEPEGTETERCWKQIYVCNRVQRNSPPFSKANLISCTSSDGVIIL